MLKLKAQPVSEHGNCYPFFEGLGNRYSEKKNAFLGRRSNHNFHFHALACDYPERNLFEQDYYDSGFMLSYMDIHKKNPQDERYFTMNVYKSLVLFSVTVFFLTGCFVSPSLSDGRQKSRKGDELFAAGEVDGAAELWKEALNDKRSADLYGKIVMVQIIKNDFVQAEKWTLEGLTYFPNNVNLVFNNALINFHNKDFTSTLDNLDKVLEINRYYPNAHFLKGLIYEKQGDKTSARKEFVNEININPGSKGAWQKLRGLTND